MSAARPSIRRVLAAAAALLVAWLVAPGAVPLYDGLAFPDEPYRFVSPPPGSRATPPPTTARGSSSVDAGSNVATIYVDTGEQAPQLSVVLPGRVLAVADGGRSVTVSAVPQAPDRQPSKGSIDGNVYRVAASAPPAGQVTYAPPAGDSASASAIVLRATSAKKPAPSFLYRPAPSVAWKVLPTSRWGNDIYRAQFAGLGDYALAFGTTSAGGHGSGPLPIVVSALLVVVLGAAVAVVAVRMSRRRAPDA